MQNDDYRAIAKRYDTLISPLNAGLRDIGLKMHPPEPGMDVLDVGCGTGEYLLRFQRAGCNVYGLDMSPSMLGVARGKLGDGARLHLGDATQMPFRDDQFDLITTTLMLHEMPQDVRMETLGEMKRTLKPDGRLLLIDFHPGKRSFPKGWIARPVITFIEMLAGGEHFKNFRRFMRMGGLPTLIPEAGLAVEKQKVVTGGNMALFLLKAQG